MKKQAMTLLIGTVLASLTASAIGAVEVRSVDETNTKFKMEMQAGKVNTKDATVKENVRQNALKEFSDLTKGQIVGTEFSAALNAHLVVNEGGEMKGLDMTKIAKSIIDASKTRKNTSTNDAKTSELLKQKDRALELAPKFMSLASVTSKAGGKADGQLNAFAKQMSLIPEMLSSMDVDAVRTHNDIMELAIENKLRNPEMNGDEAFKAALESKFPGKSDQKIADLNGCSRGFLL